MFRKPKPNPLHRVIGAPILVIGVLASLLSTGFQCDVTEIIPMPYGPTGGVITTPTFDASGSTFDNEPALTVGQLENPGSSSAAGPACWSGQFTGHIHQIDGFSYGPAVNATVTIIQDTSGETIATTTSGHDGYYEIYAAWPCGTYTVCAELGELEGKNPSSAYIHEDLGLYPGREVVVNVNMD